MPVILLTIQGQAYKVACEEGQETRLAQLGRMLDSRVASIAGGAPESGQSQLLLMAALMVLDDYLDLQERFERQVQEQELQARARAFEDGNDATRDSIVQDNNLGQLIRTTTHTLSLLAERIEVIASTKS